MTWEDIITHGVEDRELTEWRGRISKGQKKQREAWVYFSFSHSAVKLKNFTPISYNGLGLAVSF
jgi:uncharacterized protein YecE (DUF72 family)